MALGAFFIHLNFSLQFTSFDVGSRRIYENFSSIQSRVNHGIMRNPSLLAYLKRYRCIIKLYQKLANGNFVLPCYLLNISWQFEHTYLFSLSPLPKPSRFIVAIVISQIHLCSNCFDFAIK
jgi:hypothetical protein